MTYAGVVTASTSGMTPISTLTAGSTTASFDITSIPGTYRTLMGILSANHMAGGTNFNSLTLRFNNDSGAGDYYWMGNKLPSTSSTYPTVVASTTTDTSMVIGNISPYKFQYPGQVRFFVTAYANTAAFTQVSSVSSYGDGNTSSNLWLYEYAGIWQSMVTVNRLTLSVSGSFSAGTDFALYGLA